MQLEPHDIQYLKEKRQFEQYHSPFSKELIAPLILIDETVNKLMQGGYEIKDIKTIKKNIEQLKKLIKQNEKSAPYLFYAPDGNQNISTMVPEKFLVDKILDIIKMNYRNNYFNVDVIIRELGMSRSIFYQKIKISAVPSPNVLIKNYRLQMAEGLLAQKKLTVSEIAYSVGFSSPAYFSKIFKEKYRVTPKDYSNHI